MTIETKDPKPHGDITILPMTDAERQRLYLGEYCVDELELTEPVFNCSLTDINPENFRSPECFSPADIIAKAVLSDPLVDAVLEDRINMLKRATTVKLPEPFKFIPITFTVSKAIQQLDKAIEAGAFDNVAPTPLVQYGGCKLPDIDKDMPSKHLIEDIFPTMESVFYINETIKLNQKPFSKGQIVGLYGNSNIGPQIIIKPSVDLARYPHKCPRCNEAAYIGFASIECSRNCRQ